MPKVRSYDAYYVDRGTDDITELFDRGAFIEENGVLAIEAEYALSCDAYAYLTPDVTKKIYWRHIRSTSGGGRGLAMKTFGRPYTWNDARDAPI